MNTLWARRKSRLGAQAAGHISDWGNTMTIEFSCQGCQYLFKVPDTMAGKKGKCPKCGSITPIPTASGSPISAAPPPPSVAPLGPDDRNLDQGPDDYDDRPRRRKKSNKGLILGLTIGGGVLLLVGVGLLLWWLLGSSGLSSDELKYLPDNCVAVGSFKPADFFSSGLVKDNAKEMNTAQMESEMKKATGFVPKDIDKVVLGTDGEGLTVIVKMNKAVKADDIKKAFAEKMDFKDEAKVGSLTMYRTELGDDGPAFCVADSKTVIGGFPAKGLEKVLKRGKKADMSPAFQKIVDKADFGKTVAFAVDIKALAKKGEGLKGLANLAREAGGGMGGEVDMAIGQLGMLGNQVDGIAGSVKISSGVDVEGTLFCKDADTAKNFKKMADEGIKAAKSSPFTPPEAKELLDKVKVSQSGNTVSGSVSISSSFINKMKKK
jgi:hypothetical protein